MLYPIHLVIIFVIVDNKQNCIDASGKILVLLFLRDKASDASPDGIRPSGESHRLLEVVNLLENFLSEGDRYDWHE